MRRRTLARESPVLRGVGLFSASPASVRFLPAPPGTGVRIRRTDLPTIDPLPATVDHVTSDSACCGLPPGIPPRNTTLVTGSTLVARTIEHAMSALAGLGITDAIIEIDAPELPILDGSALAYVEALAPLAQDATNTIEPLTLAREVMVRDGEATILATPRAAPGCSIEYRLQYPPGSGLGSQAARWDGTPEAFVREVAPARTFCLAKEAHALRAAGLFTHVSPREMLVIAPDGTPVDNALRFPDEPARHKLLDLIGDLALLGRPLQADVLATRSGHAHTHAMVRVLLAT
ncbi:MAG: UDP-3-O-acyl-N-acetylglucosamine deacetylase [Phycisphaerales bacterium]|nr:UDP-3-O-acyl-N-acetylglucosamine deacetylase [Phycisphaerales bacterium]